MYPPHPGLVLTTRTTATTRSWWLHHPSCTQRMMATILWVDPVVHQGTPLTTVSGCSRIRGEWVLLMLLGMTQSMLPRSR